MAIQTTSVSLVAATSGTFTFAKPPETYGKNVNGAVFDVVVNEVWFSADVDNMDGTMTGTVNVPGAVTGTVDIVIYDTPTAT